MATGAAAAAAALNSTVSAAAAAATVDVSKLNMFEHAWHNLFLDNSYPELTLAAVLFAVHETVYFGRFVPYWIMDHIPYFQQYKIQGLPAKSSDVYRVTIHALKSQIFVQLPMLVGFYGLCSLLDIPIYEVPFPPLSTIVLQQAYFILWEDTFHYWCHRAMHWGPLYKYIHKMHHEFQAPFGLTAEYAHTLEVLVLGMGFFIGPLTWAGALMLAAAQGVENLSAWRLHVVSMATWIGMRLLLTVDEHSGYDFPWSIHHFIPFWAGSDFHDYHHMAFIGNYSSTLRVWDWICGTDAGYNKHAKKMRETKKSRKLQAIQDAVAEAKAKEAAMLAAGERESAARGKKRQ
ncbi:C-4 methyl sterol oxidase [Zopfochytrium polystomum]|nr:C-4 methyl sterol oxidase [Zopfochytrium polystomum]